MRNALESFTVVFTKADETTINFPEQICTLVSSLPKDNILEYIINHWNKISDIIGFTGEVVKEAIPVIKVGGAIYSYAARKKQIYYLTALAQKVNEDVVSSDANYKQKLYAFMEKEENLMFIASTIEVSKLSQSVKVAAILGCYAGVYLEKLSDTDYIDLLILESLRTLNDYDIELFVKIYDLISKSESLSMVKDDIVDKVGIEAKYTLNKLANSQIVTTDLRSIAKYATLGPTLPVEFYSITDVAHRLYKLIFNLGLVITETEVVKE